MFLYLCLYLPESCQEAAWQALCDHNKGSLWLFVKKGFNGGLSNYKTTLCEVIAFEDGCSEAGRNPDSSVWFLFSEQQYGVG